MDIELVKFFFTLQNSIRMYHWQTNTYSRHIATDTLLTGLNLLVDRFMEVFQGRYGKISFSGEVGCGFLTLTDSTAPEMIKESIAFLKGLERSEKGTKLKGDPELLTIRDEMVSSLQQTLYLFTFK